MSTPKQPKAYTRGTYKKEPAEVKKPVTITVYPTDKKTIEGSKYKTISKAIEVLANEIRKTNI